MATAPLTSEELNRFVFHPATPVTGPRHDLVRETIRNAAEELVSLVPAGRHRSMMLSYLQEAMWAANAGVACDTED